MRDSTLQPLRLIAIGIGLAMLTTVVSGLVVGNLTPSHAPSVLLRHSPAPR